jgi:hypothetical protein
VGGAPDTICRCFELFSCSLQAQANKQMVQHGCGLS